MQSKIAFGYLAATQLSSFFSPSPSVPQSLTLSPPIFCLFDSSILSDSIV